MPDLRSLSAGAFLDFGWYLLTRNAAPDAVEKFRRSLWMPPKGTAPDARSPWSPENETRAFQTLKAQTTGKVPLAVTSGAS